MLALPWLSALVAISIAHPGGAPETNLEEPEPLAAPESQDAQASWDHWVLSSCETALGTGECSAVPAAEERSWTAEVTFLSDSVEVSLHKGEQVIHRTLSFSEADSQEQRHVAAGLLVAAMTAAARLAEVPAETPPPQVPPPEAPPQTEVSSRVVTPTQAVEEHRRLTVDLGATAGSLLDWTRWAAGARFRATTWARPEGIFSPWGITGALATFHSLSSSPRAAGIEASLGLAFPLAANQAPLTFDLEIEALLQSMRIAQVPEAVGARTAWRGGAGLGFILALRRMALSPFLGGEAKLLGPELEITRNGERYLLVPPVSLGAQVGLRWQP